MFGNENLFRKCLITDFYQKSVRIANTKMSVEVDANKILTSIILALIIYIGKTVYQLDKDMSIVKYQVDQMNYVFQDIYELKADK